MRGNACADSSGAAGLSTAAALRSAFGRDDFTLAVLGRLGQVHLVEEHVAELLGGVDVEAVARAGIDTLGEVVDGDGEARTHLAQEITVDANAGLLHVQQDGDEREIELFIDLGEGGVFVECGSCTLRG